MEERGEKTDPFSSSLKKSLMVGSAISDFQIIFSSFCGESEMGENTDAIMASAQILPTFDFLKQAARGRE